MRRTFHSVALSPALAYASIVGNLIMSAAWAICVRHVLAGVGLVSDRKLRTLSGTPGHHDQKCLGGAYRFRCSLNEQRRGE